MVGSASSSFRSKATFPTLLVDLRWEEQQLAKTRDELFEKELREMRGTLATYREILVAHGLMQPSADFQRQ
jgi:hypothetical protein